MYRRPFLLAPPRCLDVPFDLILFICLQLLPPPQPRGLPFLSTYRTGTVLPSVLYVSLNNLFNSGPS